MGSFSSTTRSTTSGLGGLTREGRVASFSDPPTPAAPLHRRYTWPPAQDTGTVVLFIAEHGKNERP